ncbi:MAG TPA: DUF6311 domain-containing protein [Candidatus Binatia bacterium]|nr:DUF6311 domain-containing protein [Candidatus Binatia bacterium]
MNTQASLAGTSSAADIPIREQGRQNQPRWHERVWFDLAIAVVAGFLYALLVMGPRPLNPRNVNWVAYDPAYHYIGWELYRQDPHLHWPLTYTDRLGYPKGESVALVDLNPLLAVMLKPFSPLLPEPLQYFGIEVVLVCALQFFFALRLFRLLLGPDLPAIALCSAFFLLAPPLNYRFWGHYSLTNQWVLLASLLIFAQAQQESPRLARRFAISAAILAAVAAGINPYLAFQVLLILTAAVASLLWQKRITLPKSAGILALLAGVSFFVAWSLGLVISGGRGYASGGYRDLSMNLLAPFDPRSWGSIIFPRLPRAIAGQYEGYSYLGAGVLILAAIAIAAAAVNRGRLRRPNPRWLVPLALCCLLLTALALSTRITLGAGTLVDLDPRGRFTAFFAPLRASGRLFWAPYYAILTGILAAPFLLFRRVWATLLVAAMLVLQFTDTHALRQWVRTTISEEHPSPLKSPIWSQLSAFHQNLIVLPAWQCAHNASPGGPEGYRIFGFLAVRQKMRTNSYQSARYTGVAEDYHCSQAVAGLQTQPLAPDSAYVVTPQVAALIAQGPTGPGRCHDLDHFILCSSRTDFGLSPDLMTAEQRVENSVANPGFEDGDLAPWSTNGVRAGVSEAHAHSDWHSLALTGGAGTVFQDINGLQPGRTYTVSAWVSSSPASANTAQLIVYNPTNDTAASSSVIHSDPGWQLVTLPFTVGSEGAVRVHLARGAGTGTVYWDDVRISAGKEAATP